MNSIISLCHFCEAHGPCPIFSTYTLRDTKINELVDQSDGTRENVCPGCNSIGRASGIISQDAESNANFLSTQTVAISDIVPLVKHAAVRSLSCEVGASKDGSLVFFGDASRGHVLSYTFQINDSQARGFFRLFSIIVLMKDKMYLLNLQPFLMDHIKELAGELKSYSAQVHTAEQTKYSERAQRLNAGHASTQPPRSLIDLTGQKNIFAFIHSHFAWILWMGARYLTENLTFGLSSTNRNHLESVAMVELKSKDALQVKRSLFDDACEHNDFIRNSQRLLTDHFVAACYCALVGIQVVLRGPSTKTIEPIRCFAKFLPESMHHLICTSSDQYLPHTECRILSVLHSVAVPQLSENIFRIDFLDNGDDVHVKWLGCLPNKYPDLLTKILKAVNEPLLIDSVLLKQIRVMVEEWQNKVLCLRTIPSNRDVLKVKKVLGVQPHDHQLITYWNSSLPGLL